MYSATDFLNNLDRTINFLNGSADGRLRADLVTLTPNAGDLNGLAQFWAKLGIDRLDPAAVEKFVADIQQQAAAKLSAIATALARQVEALRLELNGRLPTGPDDLIVADLPANAVVLLTPPERWLMSSPPYIAVLINRLPTGHALRSVMPACDLFVTNNGPALVLGGNVNGRPGASYPLSRAISNTHHFREQTNRLTREREQREEARRKIEEASRRSTATETARRLAEAEQRIRDLEARTVQTATPT